MNFVFDRFNEAQHPRGQPGNSGQFASSPGGGGASSGEGESPGRGYSKEAVLKGDTIHTDNVRDATRALYEGRKVQLNQPREVSTLIDHLAEVTKGFERLGAKAPVFDLCNVSIPNTNLFCGESLGIPRAEMPQVPYDKMDQFQEHLARKGYKSRRETESSAYLRATQSQLNGAKVAKVMDGIREGVPKIVDRPIAISRDNYILDGHHKWAATVGLAPEGGKASNMDVVRVDIGIIDLLKEAEEFTGGKGKRGVETTGPRSGIRGTGHGAEPQPDFRGSLARQSGGDSTQPVSSLDELYELARKDEPSFRKGIDAIAERYGAKAMYTPEEYAEPGTILKSRKSAERKLASELDNDPRLLRDVIRGTVVGETVENTRRAAADFIAEQGDKILRVKDRYTDPLKGGYRDILINFRTDSGLVAEVQFNSKNMVETKNGQAHKLYEEARVLVNPTIEALQRLESRMSELYEAAYQKDGDGKGWKTGVSHDAMTRDAKDGSPIRRYKLEQEDGPSFEVVLVKEGNNLKVLSNRNGKWEPEKVLSFADLVMPEQTLGEDWDVTPMEPGELDEGPDDVTDQFDKGAVLPTRDGFYRRALDRAGDARDYQYYTLEELGPNRQLTPEGFLICYDVPAARIGEMVYGPGEVPPELGLGPGGRIRITRSEAEVFAPRSMSSLNGKPLTDDHPPVDVDPQNWGFYLKGVVVNPRRGEGRFSDFLIVDLIIYDKSLIEEVTDGKREVSCGYNPDYMQVLDPATMQPIPGRGEQVNIIYNHLALVKAGRCGPYCAIRDHKTVDKRAPASGGAFWDDARARRLDKLFRGC